ncbi:MAG: hypothetical protein WEA09_06280 [Gemmatimonadota bacterium]
MNPEPPSIHARRDRGHPGRIRLYAMGCALLMLPGALVAQAAGTEAANPFPLHPADAQIRMAVQSLPENLREGVRVLGYQEVGGAPVTLQAGDGSFVCLLSPPGVWVVESACYHESLEPFMARGRELARQGISGNERVAIRNQEAEDGTLPIPTEPAALYVTLAPAEGVDPGSGSFNDSFSRSVIYVPFATGTTTGLSERPLPGSPWLMDPGTPRAHIMFSPSMELPPALQRAQQRARQN